VAYGTADDSTEIPSGYCVMHKSLEVRNLKEDIPYNIQRAEVFQARHIFCKFLILRNSSDMVCKYLHVCNVHQ